MAKQLDSLIKPFCLTEEQQKVKSGHSAALSPADLLIGLLEISQLSIQNRIELFSSGSSSEFLLLC
jgi:hypothetical protein